MGIFTDFTIEATTATKSRVSVKELVMAVVNRIDPHQTVKVDSAVNGSYTTHKMGLSVHTDSVQAVKMLSDIAESLQKHTTHFEIEVQRLCIFGGDYTKFKTYYAHKESN